MNPEPTSVRYNNWRQVALPSPEAFTPTMPVSVVIPCYQTPPETLARTLAALEAQTYPRELFEVVVVDDGSEPPLKLPRSTPLDIKAMRHQKNRGYGVGAGAARNTGTRAASGDIVLFLDSDTMAEPGWMAAHARWHHVVSDALTLGFSAHVEVSDIDEETIRRRAGSLRDLFAGRPLDRSWIEAYMDKTDDLTSRADDLFNVVITRNFGVSKGFYELIGGGNESFKRWGLEDTEFGYRAYTQGALLVPVRDGFAWHQGRWDEGREAKRRSRRTMLGKAAQQIAHDGFRRTRPGRIFEVPQYVVTINADRHPAERIIRATGNILADRVHDLVVRIEMSARDGERLAWVQDEFGADPRVRVAPTRSALDEFPTSSFHIVLPATVFARDLVRRLRAKLGDRVTATSTLADQSQVSITRTWALHRARRAGGSPADFGEARTIPAKALQTRSAGPVGYPSKLDTLIDRMREIQSLGEGWSFLKWLAGSLGRRSIKRLASRTR